MLCGLDRAHRDCGDARSDIAELSWSLYKCED